MVLMLCLFSNFSETEVVGDLFLNRSDNKLNTTLTLFLFLNRSFTLSWGHYIGIFVALPVGTLNQFCS